LATSGISEISVRTYTICTKLQPSPQLVCALFLSLSLSLSIYIYIEREREREREEKAGRQEGSSKCDCLHKYINMSGTGPD
jgi:hypothetical protein